MSLIQVNRFRDGYTLIELIIALTLSAILLTIIGGVYVGIKNTYVYEKNFSDLTESANLASYILTENIRTAGYWGCNQNNLTDGIHGYRDNNLPFYLNGENVKPGTDVLVIKKGDKNLTHLTENINASTSTIKVQKNPLTSSNLWLLITDCSDANLVGGENYLGNTIALNQRLSHHYQIADTEVSQYTEVAYFISQSPNQTSSNQTSYSLYMLTNGSKNTSAHREELVSRVTDMQIKYGVDADGDGIVDHYLDAEQVLNWEKIQAVLLQLKIQATFKVTKDIELYATIRNRSF